MMNARCSRLLVSTVLVIVLALASVPIMAQEPPPSGFRFDAPLYALRGPHAVGVTAFSSERDGRTLEGMILYPAASPAGAGETVRYTFGLQDVFPPEINELPGSAILDAAVDAEGAPYPLVVFSHGGGWVWQLSTYLFEHLASHGFVVMAFYHPGTSVLDTIAIQSEEQEVAYWENFLNALVLQPRDITQVIDHAEALTTGEGPLAGAIDLDHIAVMGHSTGGYTAIMAAGARLSFCDVEAWCETGEFTAESMGWLCRLHSGDVHALEQRLKSAAGWEEQAGVRCSPGVLWPHLGDARVDVIVPFMPGPIKPILGDAGLSNVTVPAMLFRAGADTMGPAPNNVDLVWEHIGSEAKALVTFQGAEHMLVSTGCSAAWQEMFPYFCFDPVWDVDRAHDLINHFTTAFLLATLKDDAEAAAALAPDAVAFPGITYEATGF